MFILQLSEPQDAQRRVYFHLVDSVDGTTAKTGQTGKAWISKNGGTPAQTSASLVEVDATNMPGLYYVQLTVAEVSQPGWIQMRYKAAGTLEFQDIGQLVAYDPYSKTLGGNQSPMAFPSGADVDYKKIGRIVDEAISKIDLPEIPAQVVPKVDLTPILKAITSLKDAFPVLNVPEPEKVELGPVLAAISSVEGLVRTALEKQAEIPQLLQALDDFETRIAEADVTGMIQPQVEGILDRIRKFFDKDVESIKGTVDGLKEKLDGMPYLILNQAPKPATGKSPVEEANNGAT